MSLMVQTIASRTRIDLLAKIDSFRAAHGLSESAFGLAAVSDVKIVRRIRAGQNITLGTIERIEAWMAQQPPAIHADRKASVAAPQAAA